MSINNIVPREVLERKRRERDKAKAKRQATILDDIDETTGQPLPEPDGHPKPHGRAPVPACDRITKHLYVMQERRRVEVASLQVALERRLGRGPEQT